VWDRRRTPPSITCVGVRSKQKKVAGLMPSMTTMAVCEMAKYLGMKRSLSVKDVSPRSSQGGVHEI